MTNVMQHETNFISGASTFNDYSNLDENDKVAQLLKKVKDSDPTRLTMLKNNWASESTISDNSIGNSFESIHEEYTVKRTTSELNMGFGEQNAYYRFKDVIRNEF